MKRLPIIRHSRWLYHRIQFARWMAIWGQLGYFANQSDLEYLDAIWRGDA